MKIAVLEKTFAGVGDDEPVLAGKRVLEKELEKLHRKLNGPKTTAKHIEAKQNWIKRESKRLESESAKLAEWQESLRVRKETLRVAYEGIKFLREDLLRDGKSMDKHKSHFMSPEKNSNLRATRIGFLEGIGFEETVSVDTRRFSGGNRWLDDGSPETQQRSGSKEEKTPRDDRERIWERCKNGDDSMDGLDGFLSSRGCKHGYCKQYPSGNGQLKGKNSGLSSAVTEPVSLKVLSWNVSVCRRIPLTSSCRKSRCSQIGTC